MNGISAVPEECFYYFIFMQTFCKMDIAIQKKPDILVNETVSCLQKGNFFIFMQNHTEASLKQPERTKESLQGTPFHFGEQLKALGEVQNIAVCGFFIALYIVLSYFNIRITENIEIRFAFLSLAMAGYYGGPVMGLIVGAASDLLSMMMTAGMGSAFFFGFTISYALLGFFFGMIFYRKKITGKTAEAAAAVHFLDSITLHTIWLHMMYGMPLKALFVTRLVKAAIMLPIDALLLYLVLRALFRIVSVTDLRKAL